MKVNLIGGPFQHAHSSTWWKRPKNIEWIKNRFQEKISFYVDGSIIGGMSDNFEGIKFAWNVESRAIFSPNGIISNIDKLMETYELIFTHNEDIIKINPDKIKFIPANGFWVENPNISNKSKLVSIVTSNKNSTNGQKMRISLVNKYKNRMDIYGRGFKPLDIKDSGLSPYMFSFAIENDKYDSYFTEKLLDCFATGTIPIYYGTDKIGEYFNTDGIIRYEDFNFNFGMLNKDFYNSKIEAIKDNYNRVLEYEIPEDMIYKKYLVKYN